MSVFPVALSANPTFRDDWGNPRSGGRTHKGTDIFAPLGTPVVAVADGKLTHSQSEKGGTGAHLTEADGSSYYYAHLDRLEGEPRAVRAGEIIGYVGATGNAAGGPTHLHFEARPGGGAQVDPFLELRRLRDGSAPRAASPPLFRSSTPSPAGASGLGAVGVLLLLWWLQSQRGAARG